MQFCYPKISFRKRFCSKYTESKKQGKIGVDYAVGERPQQNYDNPTVNRMVTDVNSDNSWLFNSARGNLGIPKGQVVM